MKDLGDAQYVLGIQIVRNRKNKTLAMSQASYIDKMLSRYKMQNSKKGRCRTDMEFICQRNNVLRHLKKLRI